MFGTDVKYGESAFGVLRLYHKNSGFDWQDGLVGTGVFGATLMKVWSLEHT